MKEIPVSSEFFDPRALPKKGDDGVRRVVWCAENVKIALDAYEQGLPLAMKPFWPNNATLRRPGLLYQWSDAEIKEAAKCKANILYFADTYCQLYRPDGTYGPIKLRPYQRKYLRQLQNNRFNIFVAARQVGKTTQSAIFLLWLMIFHPYTKIACLGDKFATAAENVQKIKDIYIRLPFWLKPGVLTWNKSMISFDNGSYVMARPCNLASICGVTLSVLYFDEMSIPDDTQVREVVEFAFPTVSALNDSRIICTSSPRGRHHIFCELYMGAVAGKNGFVPFKVDWWEVPGRDEKWKAMQVAILGERGFEQQYGNKFLSDGESWLTSETFDYLQQLSIAANYMPGYMLTDNQKALTNLMKVEKVIMKSKYVNKATIMPLVELAKLIQFDKNIVQSLNDLKSMPLIICIDTGEGRHNDFTTVGFYRPELNDGKDSMMQEAFAAEVAELEANATDEANDYETDDDAFDAMCDVEDIDELTTEYLLEQSVQFRQIGALSSNQHAIPMVALFLQCFIKYFLDEEKIKIVCELDGIGRSMQYLLASDIIKNSALDIECFGTVDGKRPGVLMRGKNKVGYVYDTQQSIENNIILLTYGAAVYEVDKFQEVKPGKFAGVGAHDDWAMNAVQLGAYIKSADCKTWLDDMLVPDIPEKSEDDDDIYV